MTHMRIAIIVAMDKEFIRIKELLEQVEETAIGGRSYTSGRLGNNELVLHQCGIGKVNAAIGVTELIRLFNPDLVVSALGQNDGVQDSSKFASAYLDFIRMLREKNPSADIALISSPMADDTLRTFFKALLPAIAAEAEAQGFAGKSGKIPYHVFERGFNAGGAAHPDMAEHEVIAAEVTRFIKDEFGF